VSSRCRSRDSPKYARPSCSECASECAYASASAPCGVGNWSHRTGRSSTMHQFAPHCAEASITSYWPQSITTVTRTRESVSDSKVRAAMWGASRIAAKPGSAAKSALIITSSRTRARGRPSRKDVRYVVSGDHSRISCVATPAMRAQLQGSASEEQGSPFPLARSPQ
jgi:hypothetical protein